MFMAKNYILYHIIKVKKCLKKTNSGIYPKWPNLKMSYINMFMAKNYHIIKVRLRSHS